MPVLTLDDHETAESFVTFLRGRGARIFRMRWSESVWCITGDKELVEELERAGLKSRGYERCGFSKDGGVEWEVTLTSLRNRWSDFWDATAPLEGAIGYST